MHIEILEKISNQLESISFGVNNIWPIIASFFVGLVALVLGVTGIFQDRIRARLKPKLLITIKMESPDCCNIPLTFVRNNKLFSIDSYYFRFKIENIGNYQMEDVEAMVTEIFRKENNSFERLKSFLPQNLLWSNIHKITMQKIQPKLFKHLDFGHTIRSKDSALLFSSGTPLFVDSKLIFIFDVAVSPNNLSHVIEPGEYKIKVLFSANNIKLEEKFYNLIFKDNWDDDEEEMFSNIITIKEIENSL